MNYSSFETRAFVFDFKSDNSSHTFKGSYYDILNQVREFREKNSWGTAKMISIMITLVGDSNEFDPLVCKKVDTTINHTIIARYDEPVNELNAFISVVQKSCDFLDKIDNNCSDLTDASAEDYDNSDIVDE